MSEQDEDEMHKQSRKTIKDTLEGITAIGDRLVGKKDRRPE